ncbi:plasmid transfer protein TraA [Streptomyces sp. NPDC051658]|uniref:plasmid transfer protein TraA n=1 Tax=Streptomyces sp. NPDC051658 TaxID=3365667 RepID=UPI0037901163
MAAHEPIERAEMACDDDEIDLIQIRQPLRFGGTTILEDDDMAGSNRANNFRTQQAQQPYRPPTNGNAGASNKSNKFTNAGAAAGGFVGGVASGFVPPINITFNGRGASVPAQGGGGGTVGQSGGKVPGSDFMSNEEIRAYCEHYRKKARNLATEMAMDADHLEAVLRTIPDPAGTLGGSRARARRVTRWLKKAAAAQKAQQKYFASLYGTFEREYESNLRTIKARQEQKPVRNFGWR